MNSEFIFNLKFVHCVSFTLQSSLLSVVILLILKSSNSKCKFLFNIPTMLTYSRNILYCSLIIVYFFLLKTVTFFISSQSTELWIMVDNLTILHSRIID